ncbi:hypothetical protein BBMN23_1737 [Bifidobacterium adolescentis]|nr:hypothetical protein BBMN23_1737 [Bifidobacterium adolescentis]
MPNMESSADRVVAALHTVDEKVNAMRDQRLNDPDSFGDKIFKSVVPTLAGLVLGKAFEMVWKKSVGRKAVRADGTKNEAAEAALGIVFAVVSAGFGARSYRNCPAAGRRRLWTGGTHGRRIASKYVANIAKQSQVDMFSQGDGFSPIPLQNRAARTTMAV